MKLMMGRAEHASCSSRPIPSGIRRASAALPGMLSSPSAHWLKLPSSSPAFWVWFGIKPNSMSSPPTSTSKIPNGALHISWWRGVDRNSVSACLVEALTVEHIDWGHNQAHYFCSHAEAKNGGSTININTEPPISWYCVKKIFVMLKIHRGNKLHLKWFLVCSYKVIFV